MRSSTMSGGQRQAWAAWMARRPGSLSRGLSTTATTSGGDVVMRTFHVPSRNASFHGGEKLLASCITFEYIMTLHDCITSAFSLDFFHVVVIVLPAVSISLSIYVHPCCLSWVVRLCLAWRHVARLSTVGGPLGTLWR